MTTDGYDDANNLLARTDARGVTTRHRYDAANRIVATWDDAGSMEAFSEAHPNVSIQPADGAHMGGGARASTLDAAERGIRVLNARSAR